MATVVSSTIGLTSRDYTTLAAWEAACPGDLVAVDQVWQGLVYKDGNGTNGEFSGAATMLTIAGINVDSTRFVELKAAAGESFKDNAGVRTNALLYNRANGASISCTAAYESAIRVQVSYTRIEGLQIQGADGTIAKGVLLDSSVVGAQIRDCIIRARDVCVLTAAIPPSSSLWVNCLMLVRGAGRWIGLGLAGNSHRFEFCTVIRETNGGQAGEVTSGTMTVENCALFNFTTGVTTSGGGALAGGNNCTDLASAPGSSNQVSKTFANQFESTTNDFRAKTGSDLANGTPAPSYATEDISGFTRDGTTPYIGVWELAAAAAGIAAKTFGSQNASVQRASVY